MIEFIRDKETPFAIRWNANLGIELLALRRYASAGDEKGRLIVDTGLRAILPEATVLACELEGWVADLGWLLLRPRLFRGGELVLVLKNLDGAGKLVVGIGDVLLRLIPQRVISVSARVIVPSSARDEGNSDG